jgi:hypothetical protein
MNFKVSLRALLNQRIFTVVIVLTLAAGIGVNTAVFSVVEAALLRRLPFPEPERLVTLIERTAGMSNRLASPTSWAEWQARAKSFEELALFMWWDDETFTAGNGQAETILSIGATAGFFRVMGIRPLLGRIYGDAPGESGPEIVLSYALWQRRFGGDPKIIGTRIRSGAFSGDPTVVGIMPPAYSNLEIGWGDAWEPIFYKPDELRTQPRQSRYVRVIGRLKPGVTVAQAQAELDSIQQQLVQEMPTMYRDWRVDVEPLRDTVSGRVRPAIPGFDMDRTLVFDISLSYPDAAQRQNFVRRLYEEVRALPDVEAVGHARYFPYHARLWATQVRLEESLSSGHGPLVYANMISGDYLRAMGMPLIRGEIPAQRPSTVRPGEFIGCLVNESFARLLWRDEDPIGKVFWEGTNPPRIVTGIVGDVRQRSLAEPPRPEMYVVDDPSHFVLGTFVLRTRSRPELTIAAVRQVIRNIDTELPTNNLMPLRRFVGETIATQRMALTLLFAFGALALLLAAIGLYGVITCLISQRTAEIGTRLAIGAPRSHVLWLVIAEGLRLVAMGTALGLGAAFATGSAVRALLYGVAMADPISYAGASVLVFAVTMLACIIPAVRATHIHPAVSLREG